jgi:ribosomal protein S18 acetylase RimI-like enzyme
VIKQLLRWMFPPVPRWAIRFLEKYGDDHINRSSIDYYRNLRESDRLFMYVARVNGKKAAVLLAALEVRNGSFRTGHVVICVKPEYRKMGCARTMLGWLKKTCREKGVDLLAYVAADNTPSVELFRSLGAREVSRSTRYRRGESYLRLRLKL